MQAIRVNMHHNDCENTLHHCTYRQVRGQCLRKKQIDRSHTISKHSHTGQKILENALRARNHREAIVQCDHNGEESKNHTRGNVRNSIRNPIHTYVDYDNQKLYHYCDQSLSKSLTHESRNYAPWRARGSCFGSPAFPQRHKEMSNFAFSYIIMSDIRINNKIPNYCRLRNDKNATNKE